MEIVSKSGYVYDVSKSIIDLSEVKPKEIAWNWKPYFPAGKLVIIDGDGSVGKTTILLDIIARMTSNRAMPDGSQTDGGGAVYVLYEDGIDDTIVPRLQKMGANPEKIRAIKDVVTIEGDELVTRAFDISEDIPLLEQAVLETDAKLVVIDPITSALSANTDAYKDQQVRKALSPLISFAEEYGVTVVMVRHYTKQKTDNIRYKGMGSMAFVNISRVGLAVLPDPDDENIMLLIHTKHNLTKGAKPLRYQIVYDKDEFSYVHGREIRA